MYSRSTKLSGSGPRPRFPLNVPHVNHLGSSKTIRAHSLLLTSKMLIVSTMHDRMIKPLREEGGGLIYKHKVVCINTTQVVQSFRRHTSASKNRNDILGIMTRRLVEKSSDELPKSKSSGGTIDDGISNSAGASVSASEVCGENSRYGWGRHSGNSLKEVSSWASSTLTRVSSS